MKRYLVLMGLVLLTLPARSAAPFAVDAGLYPTPGAFQPFAAGHVAHTGDIYAYEITTPWQRGEDGTLDIYVDSRLSVLSLGSETCRGAGTHYRCPSEFDHQLGPGLVWFWVRFSPSPDLSPLVVRAVYNGQEQQHALAIQGGTFVRYLPLVVR